MRTALLPTILIAAGASLMVASTCASAQVDSDHDVQIKAESGLVFHLPKPKLPTTTIPVATIGHVDVRFCGTREKVGTDGCFTASPSLEIQFPEAIHGDVVETWYNVLASANGIRGVSRVDVATSRSIRISYTPSIDAGPHDTIRVFFVVQ